MILDVKTIESLYKCIQGCTIKAEVTMVSVSPPIAPEDTKQDEFVKEVQALKSLHHPRLIQLLAMCSRGEPVYIVTELMSKGSLKSYLACECIKTHAEIPELN